MPISPYAIQMFLDKEIPAPFLVKDRNPQFLTDCIEEVGKLPEFKTQPRKVQLEGLCFAIRLQRVLLYYAVRTGKTKLTLDWLSFLFHNLFAQRALVIVHAPIALDVWEGEIRKHSDLNIGIVRTSKNSMLDFCDMAENKQGVVIAWPTLQAMFTEKRLARKQKPNSKPRYKLYVDKELLREAAKVFDVVAIDEIHMAMHPESLRFQIASELVSNCNWRMGLTGTPIGRDPFGLWAQSYLIDDGERLGRNYFFFKHVFGKEVYSHFSYNNRELVFDSKKLPVLKEKIQDIVLTCELSEVHDVNVLSGIVSLHLSPKQIDAYNKVLSDLRKFHSGQITEKQNSFVRLRQISTGFLPFIDEDGKNSIVDFLDSAKLQWFEDFVENLDPDLPCVFFHEFIHTGQLLCNILQRHKISHGWIHGGTKNRGQILSDFQQGRLPILIANSVAGGTGTDYSRADYLCFVESPVGVITREQAKARPLARGNRPLIMDDIVCSPVEQKILDFHKEGLEISEFLLKSNGQNLAKELAL